MKIPRSMPPTRGMMSAVLLVRPGTSKSIEETFEIWRGELRIQFEGRIANGRRESSPPKTE